MSADSWERSFIERQQVARLATVGARGGPHIVPIVFAYDGERLFTPIDAKPKRVSPEALQRVRDIQANPHAAVLFDHYDEDWKQLAWVQLRGKAAYIETGTLQEAGARLLSARYLQYTPTSLAECPMVVITIERVLSWQGSG